MAGLDTRTGRWIGGDGELRQSVQRLLAAPIGSRVITRDYGSRLADLLDKPVTGALEGQALAAVSEALRLWEPRLRLAGGRLTGHSGTNRLELDLRRTDGGTAFPFILEASA